MKWNPILAINFLAFSLCFGANGLTYVGKEAAIATFECLGITLTFTGDENENSKCDVKYRVKGSSKWKPGHPLFACHREKQFRGSLVHLTPDTQYEIELIYADPDGGNGRRKLTARTWSEVFPEGQVTTVTNRTTQLTITKSGTPNAYHVVRPAPGKTAIIDGKNLARNCIRVNASYVIIRGLKLTGSATNALVIAPGMHDVVVEDCEITRWGPIGVPGSFDYGTSTGILCPDYHNRSTRLVIQRNRIHHPNGDCNSWIEKLPHKESYHPRGGSAISFIETAGNHVIRHNHLYSDTSHMFLDVLGGGSNSGRGNLYRDSDVYGNIVSHCWDDGLEIEGHNINIRIWGNVIHNANMGIATRFTGPDAGELLGPMYVWRNIMYELWRSPGDPGNGQKMGGGKGVVKAAYYCYNNTSLRIPGKVKCADVGFLTWNSQNVTARNNIYGVRRPYLEWIQYTYPDTVPIASNTSDYNMFWRAKPSRFTTPGWEAHGIYNASPIYEKVGDYGYFLKAGSPGKDAGCEIPGFADKFEGSAPDMGACEKGVFEMKVGPGVRAQALVGERTNRLGIRSIANDGQRVRLFNVRGQLVWTLQDSNVRIRAFPSLNRGIYFLQASGRKPRRISSVLWRR